MSNNYRTKRKNVYLNVEVPIIRIMLIRYTLLQTFQHVYNSYTSNEYNSI